MSTRVDSETRALRAPGPFVEPMEGSDWMLLRFEAPDTPMHTLKMVELDTSGRGRQVTLDEIAAVVPRYLGISPYYTCRVERIDGRWHWVQDQSFDLAQHLDERHVADRDELRALFVELAEGHLDRDRPLWAITLVHGLPDGRQVAIVRAHHALMDGTAAAHLFGRVTTTVPGTSPAEPGELPAARSADRPPLRRRLAAVGAATREGRRRTREFAPSADVPRKSLPRSMFNTTTGTSERRCGTSELSLPEVREVADLAGTNINGAIHGIFAIALRRHMLAHGVTPRGPLVSNFGVAEDRTRERCDGNRLATARVWLPVEDEDMVNAVRRAGRSCEESVALRRQRGFELQALAAEFSSFIPYLRERFVRFMFATPVHVLTAYVGGPRETRWFGDVKVAAWTSIAVSVTPANVSFTAYTYEDRISLGMVTTPASMEDPQAFLGVVREVVADLLVLARAES
ncbi:diacylglycerol O-acyltransferase [Marmoricola sp. OAE513]|uniref:wax ester/triacylglycerol synthase domain-containing protein n=1 Tax=Marmoricola sp. OAE513 TaxID=2817894 RepID=UPI001AE35BD9